MAGRLRTGACPARQMSEADAIVSRGHGCNCHPWHMQVSEWWNATFPNDQNWYKSGAVGARGSNYYQYVSTIIGVIEVR